MFQIVTLILVLLLFSPSFAFIGILTCDVLTIEWGFTTDVISMNLSRRNIVSIENKAFENFNNLRSLYLDSNQMTNINIETFKGLVSLNELYLSNNNITKIDDNSFVDLVNLYWLNLDYNQITGIKIEKIKGLVSVY